MPSSVRSCSDVSIRFYIASRFNRRKEVRRLYSELRARGHAVAADWTSHEPIKPYARHPKLARRYATDDTNGAAECDVFILLTDKAGTGMYVELGVALASNLIRSRPRISVVGSHLSRSMFYYHPSVKRRRTILIRYLRTFRRAWRRGRDDDRGRLAATMAPHGLCAPSTRRQAHPY